MPGVQSCPFCEKKADFGGKKRLFERMLAVLGGLCVSGF
jgi:hypothetical protein